MTDQQEPVQDLEEAVRARLDAFEEGLDGITEQLTQLKTDLALVIKLVRESR